MSEASETWADAALAARLLGLDPAGLGGVSLRALPGPVRDHWLEKLRTALPPDAPMRRVPLNVPDARLLGGLDLAATLAAGRPVAERGLLADLDGGVAVLASAERLEPGAAARFALALDAGEIALQRDGLEQRWPARFGVLALDEGMAPDERPPASLLDRLAFHLSLEGVGTGDALGASDPPDDLVAARAGLPSVRADTGIVDALCATAMALGIASIRAPLLALRAARALAALAGRDAVSEADAAQAARLVLAPRATVLPSSEEASEPDRGEEKAPAQDRDNVPGEEPDAPSAPGDRALEEVVLEAAQAAIPADLLAQLAAGQGTPARSPSSGRGGAPKLSKLRGRPVGTRQGQPGAGARLNVVETLRAAAPWQRLRRGDQARGRVAVRRDDFRVTRYRQGAESTTIFLVDASGSSAFHRLAEAKGAVELLLADCYVRRDRVALIAFRGARAELLLPPTRSLVRAKRSLASLPGGGGTPLASGIDAAAALAEAARRRGETPTVVLLTDGRANIARDGTPARSRAEEEALGAARRVRASGLAVLFVDTSPRPQAQGRHLAAEMRAHYLPLPYADAAALSRAVRASL